ncbi:tRNA (guanine-N7-)-methyltransferase [Entomoplasma freundtii]|uniref:tRNA (guanine-N(7)-)-methyltransferase n=1 Tax=Entomoplasma freundtii TaxID=74700 RepID=A0A2K8NSW1_9MOLU|nr:tRNA (guanosine(46)-N7)-methyltransferase TrmB [Entomoplasma freundtii]ATZ16646.1 tRNA (guanine-N(7)-)-methyltransferase [Entomoplasma freundtii]TDY58187.1 tRNA (guanine-N7-)-methyltransferase [Entomoplasma freundtii]
MRLRNKQWVEVFLQENANCLINFDELTKPETNKVDRFNALFPKRQPLYLEIGSGKGNFLWLQSKHNQANNYLGLEKEKTVVGVALKRVLQENDGLCPDNLRFSEQFAENLTTLFPDESIEHLFLNFSDPWPKAKHAKKRLTYRTFLEQYWTILKPGGLLEFKTDNDQLFAFTLAEVEIFQKFKILAVTTDLYQNQELLVNNIPTEYETKFHQQGKNINKIVLQKIV